MKREMTNELKEQFIAQYWGQNVFHRDDLVFHNEPVNANSLQFIEDSYLGLRNLSSITDEDAIEVVSIVEKLGLRSSAMRDPQAFLAPMKEGRGTTHIVAPVVDYLRSKGYALPYMGISVEQQVELGWIKLTND